MGCGEFLEEMLYVEVEVLPLFLPGVRNTADNRAKHESSHKGEEHEVDEAFQSIITQSSHGLDVVLQKRERH